MPDSVPAIAGHSLPLPVFIKRFSFRRVLAALGLLLLLGIGGAMWLVASDYGRRQVTAVVRRTLTHNSELVLEPFEVEISPWRDFPHLTASLVHLGLTDTAYRRAVPVLRVARADLRLELLPLWHGRVQVTRLVLNDVDFQEQVDSLGRTWGLRGKRRKGTAPPPTFTLDLEELLVHNFRMRVGNDYLHSALGTLVREARLSARLRGGVLRVAGRLDGELSYLRTRAGALFEREPVWAQVNYTYTFANRQGRLWNTRATLNGDTIRVHGTHTVDPQQPTGTLLDLHFVGNQPLTDVLQAALPPRLEPYLAGATSPSKAHIHYTIEGLSGATVRPHTVLDFGLRNASLQWPDSSRRISRWDLQGTLDNGAAHNRASTALTLRQCRIYSSAGQLDVALSLRNFAAPYLDGRFRGRTELRQLAALVAPGRWRARRGIADLDVRLRGLLPPRPGSPEAARPHRNPSLRGTVALSGASFTVPFRGADVSELNVRVGLRDSLWQLSNAAGVLNGMRFQASATTTYLLDYLTSRHATARISGRFAVDELRLAGLKDLMRPVPRSMGTGFSPTSLPKPRRARRNKAQLAATLGNGLIPNGLLLNVSLRCQRLVLATDTLTHLAVTLRHDGRRVELDHVAGGLWGGEVRGRVAWPTDPANRVAPVQYQLGVHFAALNYEQLLARLLRPGPRAARPAGRKTRGEALPALRDLLLTANGALTVDIDRVQLPGTESLSQVTLRLEKTGTVLHMPFLRFLTSQSGHGEATATAQVENMRLLSATADVTLRYANLDVQRLLALVASLPAPRDSVPTARTLARAERRATRRAQRLESAENTSLLANSALSAVLRVEADRVRYGAITGSRFRLVSHLLDGEARLDNCSLDALLGHISLSGRILSTPSRFHHPTEAQLRFDDVQLPALFATATSLGLNVLGGDNIRGTVRGVADLHTDLGATFLPTMSRTAGYLKTDIQDLELLDVEALIEALKFMNSERTSHLYFEPVSSEFILANGQLFIPGLRLNSNLSNLELSGSYGLDGRANLYVGLKPMQALFGNNAKRISRIQNGEPVSHSDRKLTYVNLRRTAPKGKYKVRLFQRDEHRHEQQALRDMCRELLLTQRLDTTARLLR